MNMASDHLASKGSFSCPPAGREKPWCCILFIADSEKVGLLCVRMHDNKEEKESEENIPFSLPLSTTTPPSLLAATPPPVSFLCFF